MKRVVRPSTRHLRPFAHHTPSVLISSSSSFISSHRPFQRLQDVLEAQRAKVNAQSVTEAELTDLHEAAESLKARGTEISPTERQLLSAVTIIDKLMHQNRSAERQHSRELARRQRQMQALLELVRMTEQQRIEPMLEACEQAARRKERERLMLQYDLPAEPDSGSEDEDDTNVAPGSAYSTGISPDEGQGRGRAVPDTTSLTSFAEGAARLRRGVSPNSGQSMAAMVSASVSTTSSLRLRGVESATEAIRASADSAAVNEDAGLHSPGATHRRKRRPNHMIERRRSEPLMVAARRKGMPGLSPVQPYSGTKNLGVAHERQSTDMILQQMALDHMRKGDAGNEAAGSDVHALAEPSPSRYDHTDRPLVALRNERAEKNGLNGISTSSASQRRQRPSSQHWPPPQVIDAKRGRSAHNVCAPSRTTAFQNGQGAAHAMCATPASSSSHISNMSPAALRRSMLLNSLASREGTAIGIAPATHAKAYVAGSDSGAAGDNLSQGSRRSSVGNGLLDLGRMGRLKDDHAAGQTTPLHAGTASWGAKPMGPPARRAANGGPPPRVVRPADAVGMMFHGTALRSSALGGTNGEGDDVFGVSTYV